MISICSLGRRGWRSVLAAGLTLTLTGPAGAAVTWLSSVDDGISRARADHKLVLVEMVSTRNPACSTRDTDVYSQPRLQGVLEGFVAVRVDADKKPADAARWNPAGYPALVVLEPDGKEVARPLGTLDGAALADSLATVLQDENDLIRLREKLAKGPDDVPALLGVARISLRRNDSEAAQPLVDRLSRSTDPEARNAVPALLLGMGLAAGKGGPTPKGQPWFERVSRDYPDTHEAQQALYLLGMVYFMQGNRPEAIRSLERVLETTTDDYLRERAQRMLRRVKPAE